MGFVGSYEEFIGSFESFDPEALGIDVDAFVDLLKGSDYVGISAYVSISDPESVGACEFEELLTRLDDELKFFNTSLEDVTSAGTRLQYSETGIGGGASQDGRTPATSAAEAARRPYWGIQGPPMGDGSNDPFRMDMCDASGACLDTNEIREWRRTFYRAFSEYLSGQGECQWSGYIDDVYLWATGSWDILGLYPPDQGWADPAVIELLVEHNAKMRPADPFSSV